ncbi:hypothetical protein NDA16_003831 [Ustilago loliicola]|nr:hypothetical protein NDA16_003831 [Ustilago loliicola]
MSPAHPATESSRHSTPATSTAGSDHAQSTSHQSNQAASAIASKLAPQPTTAEPTTPEQPTTQNLPEPRTPTPPPPPPPQQPQQQQKDQPQEKLEAPQREEHPLASIQPAYFYPTDGSASSSHDGIPVFEPTMQQFHDFYAFCEAIDSWGMQSGIVKVVPPKEWRDSLPDLRPELSKPPNQAASDEDQQDELADLSKVRIRNAIMQHFTPAGSGVWRQTNITRTAKIWNAKQWAEMCLSDGQKGPEMDRMKWKVEVEGVSNGGWGPKNIGTKDSATSSILEEDGVRTRSGKARPSEPKPALKRKRADGDDVTATPQRQDTQDDKEVNQHQEASSTPPPTAASPSSPERRSQRLVQNSPQTAPSASSRDASPVKKKNWEAEATTQDEWRAFDYHNCWRKEALSIEQLCALNGNQQSASKSKANATRDTATTDDKDASAAPPALPSPSDWTPEVCREIESEYWRSLNFGKPPMYGADLKGTLFDDRTKHWNVGKLDNVLTRLRLKRKLPGVNTPYLYWGMWRATFAWHVEDMDLYSINYIHFGAPKQWYAIRQADRQRFESAMAGAFPSDSRRCPHFMRHKSYLASPSFLASHGIRPLKLVHNAGEFVITYPYGYHSGFNLGYNCAESVNFALESWLDIGRKANYCHCDMSQNSVRIDVDAMLDESKEMEELERKRELRRAKEDTVRALEEEELEKRRVKNEKAKERRRLKKEADEAAAAAAGPAVPLPFQGDEGFYIDPKEAASSPCVFCPADVHTDLVATPADVPSTNPKLKAMAGRHAHRLCASFVPETWVGKQGKADVVCGIEGIDKARFSLKCQICPNANLQKLYPKIQCTRGKCPRSAHVSCALVEDNGWFVDVVAGETADRLEGKKEAATAKASQTDGLEDGERLVVLCKTHNPLFREAEEARKAEALRERIYALPCPSMVKIRTSGGMFQALMVEVREDEDEIIIEDEGRPSAVKFQQIILDSPSEGPPVKEESMIGEAEATVAAASNGDTDAPPAKRRRKQSEKASAAAKAASEEAVEAAILAEADAAARAEAQATKRPRKAKTKAVAAQQAVASQADAEAQAMLEAAESLSTVAGKKGQKGQKAESAAREAKPKRQTKKKALAGQLAANGDAVGAASFDAQQQQSAPEVAWPGHPMQHPGMQAQQQQLPQPPKRGPRATYAAQPPISQQPPQQQQQQQPQYTEQHPQYHHPHQQHQQPHPRYGMEYGQIYRNQQYPVQGEYGQYSNHYAHSHASAYQAGGRELDSEAADRHTMASRYAQSSVSAASPSYDHPRAAPYHPPQYQQHPAYPAQPSHAESTKSAAAPSDTSASPVASVAHPSATQYGYISAPPSGYLNQTPPLPTYAKPLSQQPLHMPQMSQRGTKGILNSRGSSSSSKGKLEE